jgi:hypothetical protein
MLLIVGHLLAQRNRINSPSFGKLTDRFLSIWDYSFNESYRAGKNEHETVNYFQDKGWFTEIAEVQVFLRDVDFCVQQLLEYASSDSSSTHFRPD